MADRDSFPVAPVALGTAAAVVAGGCFYLAWSRRGRGRVVVPPAKLDLLAIVTGGNRGIGFEIAKGLAQRGASVVVGSRRAESGHKAVQELISATGNERIVAFPIDLGSRSSTENFVRELERHVAEVGPSRPAVLINNGGCMIGTHQTVTIGQQPVEKTFAVNHLGTMRLTLGLLPLLRASARASKEASRVVTVSSRLERNADLRSALSKSSGGLIFADKPGGGEKYSPFKAYGISKQANILMGLQLNQEESNDAIRAVAVTPGMANTSLGRWHYLFALTAPLRWLLLPTAAHAAIVAVEAACCPLPLTGYYGHAKKKKKKDEEEGEEVAEDDERRGGKIVPVLDASVASQDRELAVELWQTSLALLDGERERH